MCNFRPLVCASIKYFVYINCFKAVTKINKLKCLFQLSSEQKFVMFHFENVDVFCFLYIFSFFKPEQ